MLNFNLKIKYERPNDEKRTFIQDGDILIMKGHCEKDGLRIGFGEVTDKILPAVNFSFSE